MLETKFRADFLTHVSPALSGNIAVVNAFDRLLGPKGDQYAEYDDPDLPTNSRQP